MSDSDNLDSILAFLWVVGIVTQLVVGLGRFGMECRFKPCADAGVQEVNLCG